MVKEWIIKQIKIWYKAIIFVICLIIFDIIWIYMNNITNIQSVFALDVMIIMAVIITRQLMELLSTCG